MKYCIVLALFTFIGCAKPVAYSQNQYGSFLSVEGSGDEMKDYLDLSIRAREICRAQGTSYLNVIDAHGNRVNNNSGQVRSGYTLTYNCR